MWGDAMAGYYPILKGRKAEFQAIDNLAGELAPHIVPIFEVVPDKGPIEDARKFIERVKRTLPPGMVVAVDVQHLPEPMTGTRRPLHDIAVDLEAWRISALPVVHLQDTTQQLADVRSAAAMHGGGVVRVTASHAEPDVTEVDGRLSQVLAVIELRTEDCIVVLDAAEVRSDQDLTKAEPLLRKHLAWTRRHHWKDVVVASGAMPPNLSQVPPHRATPLRRRDFELWQRLQQHGVQFADYCIAHPGTSGKGWGPAPNIRHTGRDTWWTYRTTRDGKGNIGIYDICKALVSADHWPAAGRHFSWGDEQIALRAAGHAGTGVATDWIAWGTSHHLAYVAAQLGLTTTA
ncbi:beta family protein [Micromonospora sp. D75]|nr:beta family protein [Micromonospora sp. D75]